MRRILFSFLACINVVAFVSLAGCGSSDEGVTSVEEVVVVPETMIETSPIDEILFVSSSADITDNNHNEEIDVELNESDEIIGETADLSPFIIYFSGIDVWGWTDTKSRSDVNIVVVVNPKTRHIQLINTPRDYYVPTPISEGAKDKLTHAGLYGPKVSIGALEMLYDIKIDYYLRMNFSGFEAIIDTLGGVDVYSEYDFTVEPIKNYTEGYNHLTGLEALAFVRERHAFASGDNQRGKNQMALVQAMIKKVCSLDFLINYNEAVNDLTDMYRTDIPIDLVAQLVVNQLIDDREWIVDTYAVTGFDGMESTYTSSKVGYVMIPNETTVQDAKTLINAVLNECE